MNGFLGGLKNLLGSLFSKPLVGTEVPIQKMNDYLYQSTTSPYGGNVPTPTPTSTPKVDTISLPPMTRETPIFNPQVSTESARPYAKQIIEGYKPSGVSEDYRSPLADYTDTLASVAGQYGIDPRVLPLLAIAESQALAPGTRGLANNNPFSAVVDNKLWHYPDIETGIRNYAAGMAGPLAEDQSKRIGGVNRYRMFRDVGPQTTLEDFIAGPHNPEDNPQQQIDLLLNLISQLGL